MAQKTFEELKAIFLSSPYFTDGERIAAIPYGDPAYDMFAMENLQNAYYRPLGFAKSLRFALDANGIITFYVHENDVAPYSVEQRDVRLKQKIIKLEERKHVRAKAARGRAGRDAARNQQVVDKDDHFGADWTQELGEDEFDAEEDRRFFKTGELPGTDRELEADEYADVGEVTAHLERKGNQVVVSFTHANTGNPVAAGAMVYHFKKEEWNYENWSRRFDYQFLGDLAQTDGGFHIDQKKIEREMGLLDHHLKVIVPFESIPGDTPVEVKTGESGEFRGPRDTTGNGRATIIGDEVDPRTQPMPPDAVEGTTEEDELPEEISTAAAGDVVNAFRTNEQFKQQLGVGGLPELPTSDADVERFKQEMQQRGLLFGDGTIQGIPVDAPIVPDVGGVIGREDRPHLPSEKLAEVSRVQAQAAVSTTDPVVQPPKKVKPGSQPAVMLDGIAADIEPHVGLGKNTGMADRPLPEPVPFYSKCSSDKVVSGKNNTWIVFGRDRPGGLGSGYGPGGGHTQAGAIDICVGRMSPRPISFDKQGRKIEIGPIFTPQKYTYDDGETLTVMDAARIYISQKTDLDENFDLQLPPKTKPARAVAGIAMKADGVRIMSRKHGIRLVTEDAKSISSKGGEDSGEPMGICLIAANKASELQPLIKGDNLTHLLKEMLDNQAQVAGAVASLKQDLIKLNAALLQHEHVSATAGPTVKLPSLMVENTRNIIKLVSVDTPSAFALQQNPDVMEKKYLEDGSKTAIKSKYNKVN